MCSIVEHGGIHYRIKRTKISKSTTWEFFSEFEEIYAAEYLLTVEGYLQHFSTGWGYEYLLCSLYISYVNSPQICKLFGNLGYICRRALPCRYIPTSEEICRSAHYSYKKCRPTGCRGDIHTTHPVLGCCRHLFTFRRYSPALRYIPTSEGVCRSPDYLFEKCIGCSGDIHIPHPVLRCCSIPPHYADTLLQIYPNFQSSLQICTLFI